MRHVEHLCGCLEISAPGDYVLREQSIILQPLLIHFPASPKLISHPSDSDGCEIQLWMFSKDIFRDILSTVFRWSAARGTS